MSSDTTEESQLRETFSRFDDDKDGLIDEGEFLIILQSLGEDPLNEVLSLEFAAIDANADGMVDFTEFKAWWLDYASTTGVHNG